MPGLPAGALVVVAGRGRPGEAWRATPAGASCSAWCRCATSRRRRAAAVARAGVRGRAARADSSTLTHGHPLALWLLLDVLAQQAGGGRRWSSAPCPTSSAACSASFVAGVPSPRHRLALESAAHARFDDRGLLRAVAGRRATGDELFAWLRGLSFMECGAQGLFRTTWRAR